MAMRETYSSRSVEYGLSVAKELGSLRSDLAIAGVGLHDSMLSPRKVVKGYLSSMVTKMRIRKANSTFVWFFHASCEISSIQSLPEKRLFQRIVQLQSCC